MTFCSSMILVVTSFSLLILLIWALSFSWWVWLEIYQFCYFSKNQFLVSLSFSIFFFFLLSISAHCDFFPCINFGFCLLFFFLVALGVRLGCVFDIFLISWSKLVSLWISLLGLLLQHPVEFGLLFSFLFVSKCV